MKKLCVIYNTAPHYRSAIFSAIDAEYNCDWYFGKTKSDIREMDTSLLKNVVYYSTFGNPKTVYCTFGVLRLLFKKQYQNFFILADVRSITGWLFFWLASTFFQNKKVYIWTHGWYGRERGLIAKMKLWLFGHVSGTFVYGDRAKNMLAERGIPKDKLFVIHNSLNYDVQKVLRISLKSSDIYMKHFKTNLPTIIFIGRLTEVKKLDMLVDALENLQNKGLSCNLVFVGDGSEKERLQQKVVQKHLQHQVWFYGACYDEARNAELVYNADVCVSPGNVGLTSIHALMYGCPVITHDKFEWQMPEYEVITPGITGDFFEYNNTDSLVSTINKWFTEKLYKREEVRKACYKEIDTYWNPYYQMEVIRKNMKLV